MPVDTEPEPASVNEARPQVLAGLPVLDRIKMALRGTRERRTVLIRAPNKVIAIAVMGSPKLNPTEVESYARMTSVQEEVLRVIGTSRRWVKHYPVVAALGGKPEDSDRDRVNARDRSTT